MNAFPTTIVKASHLRYGISDRNHLDIYYHKTHQDNLPVVICVHGGMWCFSDKTVAAEMAINMALRGYVVVTPSYTLSSFQTVLYHMLPTLAGFTGLTCGFWVLTKHLAYLVILILTWTCVIIIEYYPRQQNAAHHPSHIRDIQRVWTWVQSNIHRYHGNPNMCYLLGHSAGGHLVTLLGTQLGKDRCLGVVSISGVYSDRLLRQLWLGNMIMSNVFGNDVDEVDAFPIYNITTDTPPHFLINAEYDYSLKRHAFVYGSRLIDKRVPVKHKSYTCTNHFSIRKYWDRENRQILDDICAFLTSCHTRHAN